MCVASLKISLSHILIRSTGPPDLLTLLYDCELMVQMRFSAISASAGHVYLLAPVMNAHSKSMESATSHLHVEGGLESINEQSPTALL